MLCDGTTGVGEGIGSRLIWYAVYEGTTGVGEGIGSRLIWYAV